MCSILGVLSTQKIKTSTIKIMNDKMIHRGPDGEGYLFTGIPEQDTNLPFASINSKSNINISLAHRRLSIIDLSDLGHQPMPYLDNYWIVFNGEIYNHIELRSELETLGYTFKSHTDTEVILAAYDAWGRDCLNKFNGMWALAIYNSKKDTLFLSRDRFGIKPLYYYQDKNHFIFASEIKALLEHPAVTKEPNISYCKMYLKEGPKEYLQETAFKDIYRFAQASYIEKPIDELFSPLKETQFWNFEPNISSEPFNKEKAQKYANDYYELLKDAVRIRLRADVKIGTALSGGLDSSSIVFLIDEILKETNNTELQETFSTVYQSKETQYCDESKHIQTVCNLLKLRSHTIEPTLNSLPNTHRKALYHLETPPENIGIGGTSLCKLIRDKNVIVSLDGQGADEQQAGYLSYIVNYLSNLSLISLIKEIPFLLRVPGSRKHIFHGACFGIGKKIFPTSLLNWIIFRLFKKELSVYLQPLNIRLKNDTCFGGLANLIHYSDSRSMCFSLESRMPFMDYRLVEFTASIPATYKIHNGWTKYFARLAFNNKLPDSIVWRKDKMGWPVPNEYWFHGPLHQWLVDSVQNSSFIKKLSQDVSIHNILKNHHIFYALRYLNIEIWHNSFFKKRQ